MKNKVILLLLPLFIGSTASAQVNPDLYDMPMAENVLLNIRGTDNIDTYAKQSAALYVLWNIAMSGMEKAYQNTDKPIKKVIINQKLEYNNARRLVYEKYLKEINRPENEEVKDNWRKLWVKYKYNTPGFKEEIIETLFNDRAKNRYHEIKGMPITTGNTTINTTVIPTEERKNTTVPKTPEEESNTTANTTIKFGFDENYKLMPNPIIYDAPGVSKENLYNRAISWISKTYINPEEAIVLNIKGELVKIYGVEPLNKWGTSVLPYTIQLDFKDGRYKLTYANSTLKDPQTLLKDKTYTESLRSQTRDEQAVYNKKGFEFLDSIFQTINRELTGKNKSKDDW